MNNTGTICEMLVKDYLLSRGFSNTFKAFEQDIKHAKDANYQVVRFIEETTGFIEHHDIAKLVELWTLWKHNVFNRLTGEQARLASQYETDIYRLYLVRCRQKNDQAKCCEFFNKIAPIVLNNPLWTEWFALPYHVHPAQTEPFRKYFDKKWQEIFLLSLHNFLSMTIKNAPKCQLIDLVEAMKIEPTDSTAPGPFEDELMDDFAVIAQCSGPIKTASSKPSLRNLFKNFTKKSTD